MITCYKVRRVYYKRKVAVLQDLTQFIKKKSIYLIITTDICKHIFILMVFPPNVLPSKEVDASSETEL